MENNDTFHKEREEINELLLKNSNTDTKRFFALDSNVYRGGALSSKTKEMLGLVSSMVMRCDDCITYHIGKCVDEKVNKDEFIEVFNIALIVGGSIVIPHIRSAFRRLIENGIIEET